MICHFLEPLVLTFGYDGQEINESMMFKYLCTQCSRNSKVISSSCPPRLYQMLFQNQRIIQWSNLLLLLAQYFDYHTARGQRSSQLDTWVPSFICLDLYFIWGHVLFCDFAHVLLCDYSTVQLPLSYLGRLDFEINSIICAIFGRNSLGVQYLLSYLMNCCSFPRVFSSRLMWVFSTLLGISFHLDFIQW